MATQVSSSAFRTAKSLRRLIFEDASLGGSVVREGVMPVEMVGRDVQHDRDLGMKGLDRLQLKAADLQHDPGFVGGALDKSDGRRSDVAANQRLSRPPAAMISPASVVVVVLPFEPVMATMWPFEESRRQFHFADDGNAALAGLHQLRHVERDARADDDQVLVAKCALAVLPGLDADAVIEQQRNLVAKLLFRLGIGDGNARACFCRNRALATPDLPSPTTSTRLPLNPSMSSAPKPRHCATFAGAASATSTW